MRKEDWRRKARELYKNNKVFRANVLLFLTGFEKESVFRWLLEEYDFNKNEANKIVEHLKKIRKKIKEKRMLKKVSEVKKRKWLELEEINDKTEVVVLFHEGCIRHIPAFDVLVRKDLKKPRLVKWLEKFSEDYTTDCDIVKLFLKKYKNFRYVFSQDLAHIFLINVGVIATLMDIARKFRTAVVVFEGDAGWESH